MIPWDSKLPVLSSQTVVFGYRHWWDLTIWVYGPAPLKKAILVEASYTNPRQMLPLVAISLQIWANVSGTSLSYTPRCLRIGMCKPQAQG